MFHRYCILHVEALAGFGLLQAGLYWLHVEIEVKVGGEAARSTWWNTLGPNPIFLLDGKKATT